MSTYKQVVLAQRPKDMIVPGQTFKTISKPRPTESDLKSGEVLIETLYLSLDPAMRGWLNDVRSYVPPVQIDEVMRGAVVARVLASKSPKFSAGDIVTGEPGWTELAVVNAKHLAKTQIPANGRATDALGVLGLTGLTAYFGLLEIGAPKPGELVVVSGAAGATGSVVCQIALLKGARVVAIAGSEDKCEWLKSLGCEAALNYKSKDFAKDFRAATKSLIDVYFDNVGGEILDLALSRAKPFSRFVMCGGISQYNSGTGKAVGPSNYLMIVSMRIKMQGFIVFDYVKKYDQARRELAQWLGEGKIQRKEHIIKGGLDAAPQGLRDLYTGINTGKLLVEVKPEGEKAKL